MCDDTILEIIKESGKRVKKVKKTSYTIKKNFILFNHIYD
jgi:hypothetical protein